MSWREIKNMELPDISAMETGDSTTTILVFIGVALIAFLIFRKLLKIAILAAVVFMLIALFAS